ncbi:MAG TPA: archease [Nitrososphaeraceae archaeon]
MEEKFRYLEHMTDLIVEAYGNTLPELFENSTLGMINAMFDISNIELNHSLKIIAQGHDFKSLLYDWIEKIILSIYIDRMIIVKFDSFSFSKMITNDHMNNNNNNNNSNLITTTNLTEMEFVDALGLNNATESSDSKLSEECNCIYKIECTGHGDRIDLHKHEYKIEVKSVTYHEMKINRDKDGHFTSKFLVDL